jgi:hypothetical protein
VGCSLVRRCGVWWSMKGLGGLWWGVAGAVGHDGLYSSELWGRFD